MKRNFTLPLLIAMMIMPVLLNLGMVAAQSQPYFTCDSKKYQSIKENGDYWLYEVETSPVNLKPLFNITAAGATNDLNSLVFNKLDGYMYIIQIRAPHNLYRIGSDYSVVNLGPVTGFNSDAAVNAAAENNNGELIFRDTRSQDFYLLDLPTLTVSRMCDFTAPSGLSSNIGDFAYNQANGLYYGTRDNSNILAEIDLDNCTETHITLQATIPSALGAFWIGVDGKGYGYANSTGNLYEIDLETGEFWVIGQGSTTAETDGCSCEGISFHQEVDTDTLVQGDTTVITYTVYNGWSTHLSTVLFSDTLCAGMQWASEPFNLTGGILINNAGIAGTDKPGFTIDLLPKGKCSFQILLTAPIDYLGPTPCDCQAKLAGLPDRLGAPVPSDNPVTPAIADASKLTILSEDDCIGSWNTPFIMADFEFNHKSVEVYASKPLMNVVLEFSDGVHQMITGFTGYTDILEGTGANHGKCITGVWIRTACNETADGPSYGEYIPNSLWDGVCLDRTPPPPVIISFEHGSTILSGGITVIDVGDYVPGTFSTGTDTTGGGHNSTGVGIPRPPIPGRDRYRNLPESELTVFPNPVRTNSTVFIRGLVQMEEPWVMQFYSLDGRTVAGSVMESDQINLSELDLTPGMYFLEFINGSLHEDVKLIIGE
jgi:hypothetical protein